MDIENARKVIKLQEEREELSSRLNSLEDQEAIVRLSYREGLYPFYIDYTVEGELRKRIQRVVEEDIKERIALIDKQIKEL